MIDRRDRMVGWNPQAITPHVLISAYGSDWEVQTNKLDNEDINSLLYSCDVVSDAIVKMMACERNSQ